MLHVYNEISQDFGRFDVPFIVIFANAARTPADKNGCDLFPNRNV
jgi:hypothetical protein